MNMRPNSITEIDNRIPLLPLSGALLLPHTQRPLLIFEPRYIALINDILSKNRVMGLIQPENDSEESPGDQDTPLKKIGSLGYLRAFEEQNDGKYVVVLDGLSRFEILKEVPTDTPYRVAEVNIEPYADDFDPDTGIEQVDREEFLALMRAYSDFANFEFDWDGIKKIDTTQLVNMCCVMSPYGAVEKQALLEAKSLNQRAQTLIALAEMEMAKAGAKGPSSGIQ